LAQVIVRRSCINAAAHFRPSGMRALVVALLATTFPSLAASWQQLRKVIVPAPPVLEPSRVEGINGSTISFPAAMNQCLKRPKSHICDPNHVLSTFVTDRQSAALSSLAATDGSLVCPNGGYEVYIALLAVPAKGLHAVATELGHRWGVLGGRCRNGVVALLSTSSQSVAIAAGSGLQVEGRVVKAAVDMPWTSADKVVTSLVLELSATLEGSKTARPQLYSKLSWYTNLALLCTFTGCLALGFLLLVVCLLYDTVRAMRHRARYRSCHSKVMRVHNAFQEHREERLCPCCLDPVTIDPQVDVVTFLCGHRFHLACANEWLKRHHGFGKVCLICHGPWSLPDNMKAENAINDGKLFHLQRLHEMFPDIIDTPALERWCSCHTEIWLSEIQCPRYSSIFARRWMPGSSCRRCRHQ